MTRQEAYAHTHQDCTAALSSSFFKKHNTCVRANLCIWHNKCWEKCNLINFNDSQICHWIEMCMNGQIMTMIVILQLQLSCDMKCGFTCIVTTMCVHHSHVMGNCGWWAHGYSWRRISWVWNRIAPKILDRHIIFESTFQNWYKYIIRVMRKI